MKSSHTPGPWKLLDPDQVRGPEGQFVADCHCGFMREADHANARLIASAPELLEACKATCAAVADCLPISGNTDKLDVLYYKAKLLSINQAASVCSQAILKAEGNA